MQERYGRGTNYEDNPMKVLDRGQTVDITRNPGLIKAHIEHCWSSRRNIADPKMSDAVWSTGTLSQYYKNVTRIDLIGARIPIDVTMQNKKSVYLFLRAGNFATGNIHFSRPYDDARAKTEIPDLFDLDGAFAHFFITSSPIVWQDVNTLPTYSFCFASPVTFTKFDISVLVEPDDPTTAPSEPLFVASGEDIRLAFRILSQN